MWDFSVVDYKNVKHKRGNYQSRAVKKKLIEGPVTNNSDGGRHSSSSNHTTSSSINSLCANGPVEDR